LPLGDKRFLAVVQVDRQRLLIGATCHSISVLQRLEERGEASDKEQGGRM
jgi:flagellar biogenesis protein FliO